MAGASEEAQKQLDTSQRVLTNRSSHKLDLRLWTSCFPNEKPEYVTKTSAPSFVGLFCARPSSRPPDQQGCQIRALTSDAQLRQIDDI